MIQSLLAEVKVLKALSYAAAGTDDTLNGEIIDTQNAENVLFAIKLGAITGSCVLNFKVQQGAAANMSDAADLLGTNQLIADDQDGKIVLIEIARPQERYIRVVCTRATANAVIEAGIALLSGMPMQPVTQSQAAGTPEFHSEPIEGTA